MWLDLPFMIYLAVYLLVVVAFIRELLLLLCIAKANKLTLKIKQVRQVEGLTR